VRRLDLARRSLRRADLSQAFLPGVILDGADLRGARLDQADLRGASMVSTDLRGASLVDVVLDGATVCPPRLPAAADAESADAERGTDNGLSPLPPKDCFARLKGADLAFASLVGADLRGAWLTGADLNQAHLELAELDAADLDLASLRGANLFGASLYWTTMRAAVFRETNIAHVATEEPTDADFATFFTDASAHLPQIERRVLNLKGRVSKLALAYVAGKRRSDLEARLEKILAENKASPVRELAVLPPRNKHFGGDAAVNQEVLEILGLDAYVDQAEYAGRLLLCRRNILCGKDAETRPGILRGLADIAKYQKSYPELGGLAEEVAACPASALVKKEQVASEPCLPPPHRARPDR
jgi:uncharacterized protein YjbI with pentapeptide repeats